ncbi:MAG TPA: ABC transporter ATP-binding protein, partial [Kofleriaceae bacterium]
MLRLAAVSKAYGARRALVGVTLEVAAGEAVLLVGRNGAGKSTLLRIATGFIDADAGEVAIGGVDVMRERARAQAKLGYLPEHSPAPGELSVRDHLVLRARMKRVGAETVDRAMEAAGVASEAKRRIATLSKGYRQRVGLADALLGDPELLVLDEPT